MAYEDGAGGSIQNAGIAARQNESNRENNDCGLPKNKEYRGLRSACFSHLNTTPGAMSESTRFKDQTGSVTKEGRLLQNCSALECPLARAFGV